MVGWTSQREDERTEAREIQTTWKRKGKTPRKPEEKRHSELRGSNGHPSVHVIGAPEEEMGQKQF